MSLTLEKFLIYGKLMKETRLLKTYKKKQIEMESKTDTNTSFQECEMDSLLFFVYLQLENH